MTFAQHLRFFVRSFFLQTGWNYLKFQNLGLFFVMWPFLKHLYKKDTDAIPSVTERYLSSFNTQPVLAAFCFGALAREEEYIAQTKNLTEFNAEINNWLSIKRGLSITTASIGDRLFWGSLKPLTLLLALLIWLLVGIPFFGDQTVAQQPPLWYVCWGMLAPFVAFKAIALPVKWQGIRISYESDGNASFGLTKFDWNRTIYYAKIIGMFFTIGMIVLGLIFYLKGLNACDLQFITRSVIVLFFVCISFITRRLRIPNMYLYLAAVVIFNIVCYL